MIPWKLPNFILPQETDAEFVSALSSPSIPVCNPRGTGTASGKLETIQVNATADDGHWEYSGGFSTTDVQFGSMTPAA